MSPLPRHVLWSACAPLAFAAVAATPVAWLGCRNRGLLALVVVLASTVAALFTTVRGARLLRRRDPGHRPWLVSTLLLALPAIGLLLLA